MHTKVILLVEDNQDDEELALLAFKRSNIANRVVVARDGAEALDYLFGTGSHAGRDAPVLPQLVLLELRRGGFDPSWQRVETAEELRAARAQGSWEVVLWDYTLPGFDPTVALALLQQAAEDLPFIVVSGTLGDEQAVQLMRAG